MNTHTPDPASHAAGPAPATVRFIAAPPAAAAGRLFLADLGIRIDRHGLWYYHGSLIERKEVVCLFASALTRDEAGGYWLVTSAEMGRIEVEDAPFLAVELFVAGEGAARLISLRTNVDEIVEMNAEHPLVVTTNPATGEPAPYVHLNRGLSARLSRAVFYELVAMAEPGDQQENRITFGVWSAGYWFPLGEVEC
jgi:hypothetical protein